ncbi:PEP-CTERM domain protein [Sphingomonas sp. Leaf357]|nr:NF038122 family metalloprotease [Sphingomonas sp. Leaf357]KQS01550.1 PEP-CTERM domain protein [Sphingomonas sp. Leaf357]
MKISKRLLASVAALGVLSAGTAQATTFVLTDTGGAAVGTQARAGFEIAAAYWASVLKDNVTINLNIGFSALGTGILGSTGSTRSLLSMNQAYSLLNADKTSALDNQAVANLRPLGTSTAIAGAGAVSAISNGFANGVNATNGYTDLSTRIDNDGSVNNSTVAVTKASAKAMGATVDVNGAAITNTGADGSITFSNLFKFDFDPTDGISSDSFDFIGVAIHEIGHALGFVSGVDSVDARTSPGSTSLSSLEGFVVMSQLDLFRYSSAGNLDWSTQNVPYFSIDGGVTQLFGDSRFSTGVLNGDGRQASHWKDSASGVPQLGILDPTSGYGQMQEITALDLAAYDAIGWNIGFDVLGNSGYRYTTADAYRAFAVAVPEPTTWGMMILGFGMVGASARYRRRTAKVAFA